MSHYTHLSIEERESLLLSIGAGKTLREIAKILQRSPSTLSRELKRNCENREEYSPDKAARNYRKRRKKCCRQRRLKEAAAKALIQRLFLEQQWSPEQIDNRLKLEKNEIQVSYATIYRSIYAGDLETENLSHGQRGVARKLRHRGKTRRKKGTEERRGKIVISHSIEERPDEARYRTELGHWEADTVAGKTGSSCMVTLADRKSRFVLGKRVARKAAAEVEEGICYDILDLGKQLQPIGMLVVLDSILNRITQNRAKGRNTFIFIDEIYLLFQHEYSANFLFTLWKRVRKYGAYCTGITQNVDDLLQSHTARTMLANSEFIIMLNQASTDRIELAKLLNISDLQLSYITNVGAGQGLLKVGSSLVPFVNKFPRNTELYKLMTTKFGEV